MNSDFAAWASPQFTPRVTGQRAGDMALPKPPEWVERGLCAQIDTELFFPEEGGSSKAAKKVCAQCPVIEQCLAYALDRHERYGIWGGASERERRKLWDQEAV